MNDVIEQHLKELNVNVKSSLLGDLPLIDQFLVRFKPYVDSVTEGGHYKYVYDGAHSSEQQDWVRNISDNDDLHQSLIQVTETLFNVTQKQELSILLSILNDFKIDIDMKETEEKFCDPCNGHGEVLEEGWCEDEEVDEHEAICPDCNGEGVIIVDNDNFLNLTPTVLNSFIHLDKRLEKNISNINRVIERILTI